MNELYGTSPIKRTRRTRDELSDVLTVVRTILDGEESQITLRHLFYRLVGAHVIPKDEKAYKSLCNHLAKWRRSGEIPWHAFTDNTRWHICQKTFDSLEDAMQNTLKNYRRNMWSTQPYYIEVWVEKDAIAGIVSKTANTFGVPVFVARGFASLSSLHDASETFREATETGKKAVIYHLGDYDPSGIAAGESVIKAFRDDFKVNIEFIRIAVTPEQIQRLELPTRPTKESDPRARKWTGGDCVELDTMPPAAIRELVESSILQHIDRREWLALKKTEEMERQTLEEIGIRFL